MRSARRRAAVTHIASDTASACRQLRSADYPLFISHRKPINQARRKERVWPTIHNFSVWVAAPQGATGSPGLHSCGGFYSLTLIWDSFHRPLRPVREPTYFARKVPRQMSRSALGPSIARAAELVGLLFKRRIAVTVVRHLHVRIRWRPIALIARMTVQRRSTQNSSHVVLQTETLSLLLLLLLLLPLQCRAITDNVGGHVIPELSVLWSPDDLCWTHVIFPTSRPTQAIQIL